MLFAAKCNGCHVDQNNGQFNAGFRAFNVNGFTNATAYAATTPEMLAAFIQAAMAPRAAGGGCTTDPTCAPNLAAYLWSYKLPVSITQCGPADAPKSKLRRLTDKQIQLTVPAIFGPLPAETVWPNFNDGAKLIGGNTMADRLLVTDLGAEMVYSAMRPIAQAIIATNQEWAACGASTSVTCRATLQAAYAKQVWRRPLTVAENTALTASHSSAANNSEALETMLTALLTDARFLFRSEIGVNGRLTNYEIATLLAYSAWNSTPSPAVLAWAAQPNPLVKSQIVAQLETMLADPRTTAAIRELYKDFTKIDLVLTRPKSDALAFTPSIRRDLLTSAELGLDDSINGEDDFMSVFQGGAFYVNANTSAIFGADETAPELRKIYLPPGERNGLLNHPAFMATHSTSSTSGIVKRGVFTNEQILCRFLGTPPPGAATSDPDPITVDPALTSERVLLQLTHSAKMPCAGCHFQIDPAGFGFENFDVIGRYRTVEKGVVPIDASGSLDGVGSYANSADYAQMLIWSLPMRDCVAQRFLSTLVAEELPATSCLVTDYQDALEAAKTPKDLLRAMINDNFTTRSAM